MKLSPYAKDTFVAPFMSSFKSPLIRDMSKYDPQQQHWLSNFILNTMLRVTVQPPQRQLMFNFLRRAESAFREYTLGRDASFAFLESMQSPSKYMLAIHHFEVLLGQVWHAYDSLRYLAGAEKVFSKGDASVEGKLHLLYNRSKHTESAIVSGQLPSKDATLGVWLSDLGLESIDGALSFDEMVAILEDLATWADRLQDPLTLREKLESSR